MHKLSNKVSEIEYLTFQLLHSLFQQVQILLAWTFSHVLLKLYKI